MATIEFIFEENTIIIQCSPEEKIKDIKKKLIAKLEN